MTSTAASATAGGGQRMQIRPAKQLKDEVRGTLASVAKQTLRAVKSEQ